MIFSETADLQVLNTDIKNPIMGRPARRTNRGKVNWRKMNWFGLALGWLTIITWILAFWAAYPEHILVGDVGDYSRTTFVCMSVMIGMWCFIILPMLYFRRRVI